MATRHLCGVLQHLRRIVSQQHANGMTDGRLLELFLNHKDEAAFAALVHRHGPMVLAVCRRVLHNLHDAEDAFQATFLVLVRKAASIRPREMVAHWLHGVAYRTSLEARRAMAKRQAKERQASELPRAETADADWAELRPLLDQELERLPEKYRAVLVLCDLEGKTRKEVADQFGRPEGTVASRLARARKMLAKRLARHGVVLSGGSLAVALSGDTASACVPTSLVSSTIQAAMLFAVGEAAATGSISAKVVAITEAALRTMVLTKLKITTTVLLMLGVASTAVGLAGHYGLQAPRPEAKPADAEKPPTDRLGVPLAALALPAGSALAQGGGREESDVSDVFDINNGGIPLFFLTDKSVQEDLKMTDQQVKKADAASKKHSEAVEHLRSLPDQPARFLKQLELSKEAYRAVKDILNADQQKRLRQISLQQVGVRALGRRPIAEELGLSEDRQNEITALIRDASRAARREREARRWLDDSEEADKDARWMADRKMMEKIDKKLNAAILAVLTSEQKTKWKEMNGKPFTGHKLIGR